MAESTQVLIFPNLRISELEERARESRERFFSQKERTLESAKSSFHPLNLLTHHKGSLVTGAVSFLLLGKLMAGVTRAVAPKIKMSGVLGLVEAGWMWKAIQYSYKLYKFVSEK